MELEIIMSNKVSQHQKTKLNVSSYMCKIEPKDKCIHNYKHNHTHTHKGRGRGKENVESE
jgi:hypothetical protein